MTMFSHIAGNRVLDLINTVEWRLDPAQFEEDLTSYSRVLHWCEESQILSADERSGLEPMTETSPRAAAAELAEIIDIREDLYQALFEGSSRAASSLADRYRSSLARAELRKNGDSWSWADRDLSLASPSDRIVRAAIDLLKSNSLERLHQCEDRACGWVFLDDSPRRNRRWCVSSDCGDRNRSRTYYARKSKSATNSIGMRR